MTITYNRTGAERKKLVQAIAEVLNAQAKYMGAPTFAYQVDYINIDKNGNLHLEDNADSNEIQRILRQLKEQGFEYTSCCYDSPQQEPTVADEAPVDDCLPAYGESADNSLHICISMPSSLFTESAMDNLKSLVDSKAGLIKKALGITALPIIREDGKVCFPWFPGDASPEEIKAYDNFVCKLCEMARTQKRITAKEKEVDNEKYAFRCFLLHLGFIGAEFKTDRKILLRNLTGSSAFKAGQRKEAQA